MTEMRTKQEQIPYSLEWMGIFVKTWKWNFYSNNNKPIITFTYNLL